MTAVRKLKRGRRSIARWTSLVAIAVGLVLVVASPAQAQEPTGASASKDCPGLAAGLGDTITCNFTVTNIGFFPAEVTALTETSPFPGGAPVDISCVAGGATINEGDTLAPNVPCAGTFTLTIPDDPTLCNAPLVDRVDIELLYSQFPVPLVAGAFATHTTLIVCPADISITKNADALSKVGDSVNYEFVLTNEGDAPVNRTSVNDTVLGDIGSSFPATLAAGASATVNLSRTVLGTDPDPLVNTVTAIYSSGSGIFQTSDTATATDSTNLFQPSVTLDKTANATTGQVGDTVNYVITASNTSSADSPNCVGSVVDVLLGVDQAVNLAPGASVTINVSRAIAAGDPDPLINTATLTCSPVGFPNVLTASDTHEVDILPPPGGEGCTPGFWKQDQHFDSWVGFAPGDSFEDVFGVDVPGDPTLLEALNAGGGGINALMRHAVAALLNASNPDVNFDFTVAQVIALVQEAIETGDIERIKDILAAANEQDCPLN